MRSELDRKYDENLEKLTAPGGRLIIGRDEHDNAILTNFPATIPALLRTFCALNPNSEGMVAGDERFTFRELDRISEQLAHALVARGIRKGDRVGIAMRNCPAWVIGYMAVVKAGAIATLLNGWWQTHEFQHALDIVEPALILADRPRAKRLEQCPRGFPTISIDVDQPIEIALAELLNDADESLQLPEVQPEDDATILFTSGSTGDSKGALSTHRAVTTACYAYSTGLLVLLGVLTDEDRAPTAQARILVSVPLFHVTGEVPVMLNSFVVNRCMVVMPKWDAAEALRLIEEEQITYFVGVPTMSLELMNHPDRHKHDLSTLRDITAGGAPRPVSHVQRLRTEFPGAQPALGYGLTETNAAGCANFWSSYAAKPASTGRAQRPFVRVAILGENDRHLSTGETGEIAIKGAMNIRGYWRNPEATQDLFTDDGYVRTGDVGYLDDEGYLFIVDRKKEIIIRGGENISAAEVEAECYACHDVAEVAVFGVPDERLGEVPVAVVHAKNGLSEAGLRSFLEDRIAKFKIPERFIFSTEPLPRLGTGKIDRRALKTQYTS